MLGSNNLELKRLALHAHVLEIILPHGQTERFIAPLPLEFEQAPETYCRLSKPVVDYARLNGPYRYI